MTLKKDTKTPHLCNSLLPCNSIASFTFVCLVPCIKIWNGLPRLLHRRIFCFQKKKREEKRKERRNAVSGKHQKFPPTSPSSKRIIIRSKKNSLCCHKATQNASQTKKKQCLPVCTVFFILACIDDIWHINYYRSNQK